MSDYRNQHHHLGRIHWHQPDSGNVFDEKSLHTIHEFPLEILSDESKREHPPEILGGLLESRKDTTAFFPSTSKGEP